LSCRPIVLVGLPRRTNSSSFCDISRRVGGRGHKDRRSEETIFIKGPGRFYDTTRPPGQALNLEAIKGVALDREPFSHHIEQRA
jgi:hypothetical protein